MSCLSSVTTLIWLLVALHSCVYAATVNRDVISACRRRCFDDVTSGGRGSDVGFGDCFDECFESMIANANRKSAAAASDDVTDADQKRSSSTLILPRGIGSGSASKYLRIGRRWNVDDDNTNEDGEFGMAAGGDSSMVVERRRTGTSDRSSALRLLGNSAKSYLRVGKKSVQ